MKTCTQCQKSFEVTDEDRRILNMFEAPDPELCFDCRLQGRMMHYNRRKLYKRSCDLTGQSVISIFSPDKPYKVYNNKDWYSDKWDPLDYGREFDFAPPFFQQLNDLMLEVPHLALSIIGENVNSDYTNDNQKIKNCYLIFDGEQTEDSFYGETFFKLKNCVDFMLMSNSELCYETFASDNCYNLKFSNECNTCSDSWFLQDCIGVKNSFACINLHQKEYHIFNQPHTKEDYENFMMEFESGSYDALEEMKKKVATFFAGQPRRPLRNLNNINVVGNGLTNSKNAYYCFDGGNIEDSRYCTACMTGVKDCMDIHIWGENTERCYNCLLIGIGVQNVMGSIYIANGCSDIFYSYFCTGNCQNLFGCYGLRQKKYCILNKQYSKRDYEELVPKIIERMKSTGEWGKFFSPEISMFAYNETVAQEYYPQTKEEVLKKGWKWSDYEVEVKADRSILASQLPDDIKDIPDDILNWAIQCEVSDKPFKLIPQELKFYRDHNLPIPHKNPDQRHLERLKLKAPYRLWDRTCAKCNSFVKTGYSPERSEIVYCESCYLKEVY